MSHPTKAVANWLLEQYQNERHACTQLQLNKLVYIAHGWHLAADSAGDGLIDDKVIAWKYGPVIPSLREEFSQYGSRPIAEYATAWSSNGFITPKLECGKPWEMSMLGWVWHTYGHLAGGTLIEITHKPNTPWSIVTNNGKDIGFNKEISRDIIRKYYGGLLEQLRSAK